MIILPDYTSVINAFEMTLNSKHRGEKLKTNVKDIETRKTQNTERRKPNFIKRVGRKRRLI